MESYAPQEKLGRLPGFFCGASLRSLRLLRYYPPAPPGDGGKDSPASLTRAPFCRPPASENIILHYFES